MTAGPPPLRVAFVGAGRMARQHRRALARVATPHTVVGTYDADPDAAAALGPAYPTLAALLRDARPDVVHVCTPARTHFAPARAALLAGAHVYVEKPVVESVAELEELLALAAARGRLLCAGHQLARERACDALLRRAPALAPIAQVDSSFAFRPVGVDLERASPTTLAGQLLDILPHPLYLLLLALERLTPQPAAITVVATAVGVADAHAILRGDGVFARLAVTLRGRPVASTITVSGAGGALTADLIRDSVSGTANPGTTPLEKLGNPFVDGAGLILGAAAGLARRMLHGGDSPALGRLLGDFYRAAAGGGDPPQSPEHLRRVVAAYERLRREIEVVASAAAPRRSWPAPAAPLAVVTGAAGFLGREVARALAARGYRVRGVSRTAPGDDAACHEWLPVDLAASSDPAPFAGAAVVVHAAAATSGDFGAHHRHTVTATRNLVRALALARVPRLVHVSSLSVLRPPRVPWERQDETTPLADEPAAVRLGPYTWGKSEAERIVVEEGAARGIATRIVRPAALVDWNRPEVPGLLGRRLFGRWHLGLGRPGLPLAVCDVRKAGAAIAWCAAQFEEAPPVVNLIDPRVRSRGELLERFRARGWRGRLLWVPIAALVALLHGARWAVALARLRRPSPLAAWAVLRPRRFRTVVAERVFAAAGRRLPARDFAERVHE